MIELDNPLADLNAQPLTSKRLLDISVNAARKQGAEVEYFDLKATPLPFYDTDIEVEQGKVTDKRCSSTQNTNTSISIRPFIHSSNSSSILYFEK